MKKTRFSIQTFFCGPKRQERVAGAFRLFWRHGVLAAVCTLVLALPASAATFDFSAWDAMLKKYVAPKSISGIQVNAVAYQKIKVDPEFAKLLAGLENFSLDQLQTREQKLSFWINVYNVMAVKMVLDHYPVKSIRDVGNLLVKLENRLPPRAKRLLKPVERLFQKVWDIPVGVVGGVEWTLSEIEHEILRKMDEPRIHVAIVCASVSCPDLLLDVYTPERLDSQLAARMKQFLQNPGKGMRMDNEKGQLYLSSIFKWFAGDFEPMGRVILFIADHASPEQRKLLQSKKWEIIYMDYNWELNEL